MMLSARAWALLLLVARGVGRVVALSRSAVVANALLLAAIAGVLALLDHPSTGVARPGPGEDWLGLNRVLAIWTLLLVAGWVARQRRRLLIARIEDLGGEKNGSAAAGLGVLLANELAQLHDLFRDFDEGLVAQAGAAGDGTPTPGRSSLFDAAIQVDAQGGFLEGAVSAESTLAIGPLKIPVNLLLRLVNRLVQGPRLAGQVQVDAGRRIVTIELALAGQQRHWRVEDPAGLPARPLAELAHELAIRLYAELAFEQPARWTAVAALVEGLKAYRRTIRTTKEARLNLLEAERCFRDAITEDGRFDLAHYNLGIAYTALDRRSAARSAFMRSLELNPNRFDSQYALARALYQGAVADGAAAGRTSMRLALDRCERALVLAPDAEARAKVLNQKAAIQMALRGLDFFLAADACRAAVRASLRSLLWTEVAAARRPEAAARRRGQARALASGSLQQLGTILRTAGAVIQGNRFGRQRLLSAQMRWQRQRAARLAAWLTPHDADAHLALGVYLLERRRARDAVAPLQRAVQLAPRRGDPLCSLALANARLFREDDFDAAQAKAMDLLGQTSDLFLPDLAAAWRRMAAGARLLRRRVRALDAAVARGEANVHWRLALFPFRHAWFMAGRRMRRWGGVMADLPVLLGQRAAWLLRLDATVAAWRAQALRLRGLAQWRARVEALGQVAAGTAPAPQTLDALEAEAVGRGWTWEAGDAQAALGVAAMREQRHEDACGWYRKAIATFEPEFPAEIGSRGLHARLARALLAAGRRGEALDAADRAVAIDPMNAFERNQLAQCHQELQEWSRARSQWEESLRYAPDQPYPCYGIAICWFNEATAADDGERRRRNLALAAQSLERALTLFPSDAPSRLDGQYLLGQIRCALGDVGGGLALWQALESREYRPVWLGLKVAEAMLREVSLDASQARFERLAKDLASRCEGDAALAAAPIDAPPDEPSRTTHGEALAWAELGAALAVARRQCGVEDALAHVGRARAVVSAMADASSRQSWTANCDRIEGEILLRRGDAPGATKLLERALAQVGHVDGYRFLASALLQQIDPAADDAASRLAAARVASLLDHAGKIDLDGEAGPAIAELRARLAKTGASRWL